MKHTNARITQVGTKAETGGRRSRSESRGLEVTSLLIVFLRDFVEEGSVDELVEHAVTYATISSRWVKPDIRHLAIKDQKKWRPQGDSNPCCRRERAVS